VRIDYEFRPKLILDLASVPFLQLNASATPTVADLAPVVEGKPDVRRTSTIDLEELGKRFRMQRIVSGPHKSLLWQAGVLNLNRLSVWVENDSPRFSGPASRRK
jgi:type III restriction enzyme